jgi:hypothetical protein
VLACSVMVVSRVWGIEIDGGEFLDFLQTQVDCQYDSSAAGS